MHICIQCVPVLVTHIEVRSASKMLLECCDREVSSTFLSTLCLVPFLRTKQQQLEEKQADVEYELRCVLNKPGQYDAICVTLLLFISNMSYNNHNYFS